MLTNKLIRKNTTEIDKRVLSSQRVVYITSPATIKRIEDKMEAIAAIVAEKLAKVVATTNISVDAAIKLRNDLKSLPLNNGDDGELKKFMDKMKKPPLLLALKGFYSVYEKKTAPALPTKKEGCISDLLAFFQSMELIVVEGRDKFHSTYSDRYIN